MAMELLGKLSASRLPVTLRAAGLVISLRHSTDAPAYPLGRPS
ncbi:hypothetical protein QTH89_14595 [Variovorax sp. J22G21]|nr:MULTISPECIES: hypothetical protein [unclassified Variovorax]MDM0037651.1 hypothetical protein [Variovorax sp. J22R193]MDM0062427.1 hypothetical protein [Variovorax sp. J22G21]